MRFRCFASFFKRFCTSFRSWSKRRRSCSRSRCCWLRACTLSAAGSCNPPSKRIAASPGSTAAAPSAKPAGGTSARAAAAATPSSAIPRETEIELKKGDARRASTGCLNRNGHAQVGRYLPPIEMPSVSTRAPVGAVRKYGQRNQRRNAYASHDVENA